MRFRLVENLTLYRVGDIGRGAFFSDSIDYYDHSMTGYNKKDAKAYSINLSDAKVFDPMKEFGWEAYTWSDIVGKVDQFERFGIYYECDECEEYGHTSTDDISYSIGKLGYDVLILRDIRGDNGWGPSYDEYVVYNTDLLTLITLNESTHREIDGQGNERDRSSQMKLIRDKNKIVEGVVYAPEVGETYWFNTNGGIRKGVYKGSTKAWHIFSDGGRNLYVKLWSNIATSREDLEEINGIVDKMARDTHVPDVVHLPNRFTR